MPSVSVDTLNTLNAVENRGVIRSMTRMATVIFQPSELVGVVNQSILQLALAACDATNLTSFSTLVDEGFASLVLIERNPKLIEKDKTVEVELKYEHVLDGPNQQLFAPTSGILYGKGRSSIVEKSTAFYYPFGKQNPDDPTGMNGRVAILVAHTFPPADMSTMGVASAPGLPFTVIQSGEVQLPFPQENFQMMGILTTDNPRGVAEQFVAKVNQNIWLSKPARSWICSDCQWDINKLPESLSHTPTYKFTLEFQYNVDTWNPTVVFKDQKTGRPPFNIEFADPNFPDKNGVVCLVKNPWIAASASKVAVGGIAGPLAGTLIPTAPGINAPLSSLSVLGGIIGPTADLFGGGFQPAGCWTVPALEGVDFNELFQAIFEGQNVGLGAL